LPRIALAVAALITFGAALLAPFHLDDHGMLADPSIASRDGWRDVWRLGQTRPLTYFTFWLNHAAGGDDPAGYHAVNLLLHASSAVLAFACLRRLIPLEAAVIAGFVFALHPAQTEAVVYIFARSTLLSTFLALCAVYAWLRGRHWLAVGVFAAAMLAKEEVAAIPAVLAMLHLANSHNRAERPPLAAMFAIALALVGRVAYVATVTPGSGAGAQSGYRAADYLLTQGWVILRYFQLLAVPVGFTIDPDIELVADWRGAACWAAIGFACFVATRRFMRLRAGFWFIAAILLLLPTSSIFPAQDLAADRRLYLPMFAFAAMAGQALRGTAFPTLLGAGGVLLAMLSYARVDVWRSEVTLWEDAMRWAPRKVRPRIQLSRATTDPAAAMRVMEEARAMEPDNPDVASELGRLHLVAGRYSEALKEFGRELAARPGDPLALNNRGASLLALGLREPAIADFRAALDRDPCLFDARMNLRRAGEAAAPPPGCRLTDRQRALWRGG
jgi:hypothetical protein